MNINEFMRKYEIGSGRYTKRPHVVCRDGFKISVQAGYGYYSSAKSLSSTYDEVELGYPSEEEFELKEYADDKDNLCDTIYAFVPAFLVDKVLEKHGGIDETKIKKIILS